MMIRKLDVDVGGYSRGGKFGYMIYTLSLRNRRFLRSGAVYESMGLAREAAFDYIALAKTVDL